MVTTVFMDLDDTIFDFHKAEENALSETLRRMELPVLKTTLQRYSEINREQWQKLERGELTRPQVLLRRYEILFRELGVTRDPMTAQKHYEGLLAAEHPLLDGAVELLETLCGKYRLCAASNGTPTVQNRRLDESGLRRYFDRIFISGEIGAEKPSAAFFDACFSALPEVKRAETVIVGDSLTSDMLGGNNAGIRTIWYNPHGKNNPGICEITSEFRDYAELMGILETL